MKFRSPTPKPIKVDLLSGHTAIVTEEWRELPPIFHKEAIAQGCLSDNMTQEGVNATIERAAPAFDRLKVIKEAIIEMLEEGEEDPKRHESNFTGAGLPDLRILGARVGFRVDKAEMMSVWAELEKAADAGDGKATDAPADTDAQ